MCSTTVLSFIFFISLLCLPSMHECCTKMTTINKTRQTLKLTNIQSGSNITLEMNPFLIRSESGNIAITLSERYNDTDTRCYQFFIKDRNDSTSCLQISNKWTDERTDSPCTKLFSVSDEVDYVILIRIYSGGVIELKNNNKTKFIYKDREPPIDVKYISVASTQPDSYNEFYFNCYDAATNTIKYY